jgi:hypothetical protein
VHRSAFVVPSSGSAMIFARVVGGSLQGGAGIALESPDQKT